MKRKTLLKTLIIALCVCICAFTLSACEFLQCKHEFGDYMYLLDGKHYRVCIYDATHIEIGNCSVGTATCTEKASCDTCGQEYGGYGLCAGGTATCTEKAICDTCGKEYGQTKEHVYNKQVVADEYKKEEATCTSLAVYYYTCECGDIVEETFMAGIEKPHVYTAKIANNDTLLLSATCTTPAIYYKSCVGCGVKSTSTDDVFATQTLPHTYTDEIANDDTLLSSATCTAPTTYYKSCANCGAISTNMDDVFSLTDLLPHTYTDEIANYDTLLSAGTCIEPAKYYRSCAECGAISTNMDDVFSSTELLPHTFTAETVKDSAKKADATCTAPATYYKSCSLCGEISTNAEDVFETGSLASHSYDASNEYLCSFGCGCKKLSESRVGDDVNTLYFFDKANGSDQISVPNGLSTSYSTAVKFGTEAGSLAITGDEAADPKISWNMLNYQFNAGDYVVFYVYNDTNCDIIDISLGYTHRQRCYNGQWTMVLWKAEDVAAEDNGWSWLIGKNYNGDYAGITGSAITGNVYFSKAKVYSASQVADLTTVDDTFEYTVGNTTLIGTADINTSYAYQESPDAFNDAFFLNPHFVNGVLAYNIHDRVEQVGLQNEDNPFIELTLKDVYDLENCYVYMTIKGAVEDEVFIQAFSTSGHFASPDGELVETLADGSQLYKFNLAQYVNDGDNFKSLRLFVRSGLAYPITGQVVISDITVVNETPQA